MARIAMIATVPIAIATCWLRSRPTPTIPPEVWRTPDAISLRSTMLNSVLMCRAEQAGRPHNQHADDNEEGDGQFELTSDYGNIGAGKVFYDTDGKSSEDRPAGARQPAQHRGGKSIKQGAAHHVRFEKNYRRNQHTGDGTDGRRHPPPQRDHPFNANADESGRRGIFCCGLHRETHASIPEEHIKQG